MVDGERRRNSRLCLPKSGAGCLLPVTGEEGGGGGGEGHLAGGSFSKSRLVLGSHVRIRDRYLGNFFQLVQSSNERELKLNVTGISSKH